MDKLFYVIENELRSHRAIPAEAFHVGCVTPEDTTFWVMAAPEDFKLPTDAWQYVQDRLDDGTYEYSVAVLASEQGEGARPIPGSGGIVLPVWRWGTIHTAKEAISLVEELNQHFGL